MGSIISKINDDYDDYLWLCERLNVKPLSLYNDKSFYDHKDELTQKFNLNSYYPFKSKEK